MRAVSDARLLTSHRDLFAEEAFIVKSAQDLLYLKDYESYLDTAQRISATTERSPGRVGYETLVRGKQQVVDDLLEQMKNAFYALDQKVLASLVFSICLDEQRPQDVVESYTFTFSYRTTANGLSTLENITVNGAPNVVTFGDAKHSLSKVLKQVNFEMRDKPRLPEQRYIHLRLLYNDDYDGKISIPGFRTDEAGNGAAEALGWKRVTTAPGNMVYDAGFQGYAYRSIR